MIIGIVAVLTTLGFAEPLFSGICVTINEGICIASSRFKNKEIALLVIPSRKGTTAYLIINNKAIDMKKFLPPFEVKIKYDTVIAFFSNVRKEYEETWGENFFFIGYVVSYNETKKSITVELYSLSQDMLKVIALKPRVEDKVRTGQLLGVIEHPFIP